METQKAAVSEPFEATPIVKLALDLENKYCRIKLFHSSSEKKRILLPEKFSLTIHFKHLNYLLLFDRDRYFLCIMGKKPLDWARHDPSLFQHLCYKLRTPGNSTLGKKLSLPAK